MDRDAVLSALTEAFDITGQTGFFSIGMGSLQALQISKIPSLRIGDGGVSRPYSSCTVGENSTIESLSQTIEGSESLSSNRANDKVSREERVPAMIHKYIRTISHETHSFITKGPSCHPYRLDRLPRHSPPAPTARLPKWRHYSD